MGAALNACLGKLKSAAGAPVELRKVTISFANSPIRITANSLVHGGEATFKMRGATIEGVSAEQLSNFDATLTFAQDSATLNFPGKLLSLNQLIATNETSPHNTLTVPRSAP